MFAILACAATAATVEFRIADAAGRPVADAVVSLIPLDDAGKSAALAVPASGARVEIVQEGQEFTTYVTPIRKGGTIHFPNKDTVEHYIYSQSAAKRISFPLYKPGRTESAVFEQAGVVALGCNIHDWMIAYVVVVDSPWFALSGDKGAAAIGEVPPGRYRVEVWQPRLAKVETRELVVGGAAVPAQDFSLTLRPDRRIRRAPDVKAGGYR